MTQLMRALCLLAVSIAPLAHAQDCFTVAGQTGTRAQHLIGVHDTVRLSASCEYALDPEGPWSPPAALAGRDSDFLDAFETLSRARPSAGDPRVILARRTGARPNTPQQTLMLRYCAHYLLEEQLGFRVVPLAANGSFRVERFAPADCDANRVELRAVRGTEGGRLYGGAADQQLSVSQSALTLPAGDWSLFAARPGGRVGLRVGVFRAQRVVTPLQHRLRVAATGQSEGALLAAVWEPGSPGMLLRPTLRALAEPMLWPELRTAANAGWLWIAEDDHVVANAELEAEPVAVRIPDALVRARMVRRYGDAGSALAPNVSDWNAIFGDMQVCLTPDYRSPQHVEIGAAIPQGAPCATLGSLITLAQAEAGVPEVPSRICVERGMQIMSSARAERVFSGRPDCVDLPPAGREAETVLRFLVPGDRIHIEGSGLCAMLDDRPLEPGEGGVIVPTGSGLLEIRQSGGAGCTSQQSLSRLRLPVIDPEREWHPVGMYNGAAEAQMRCGTNESDGRCPWRAVEHDEERAFAFVRGRNMLTFRLSTSPVVAAAIDNDPAQPAQVQQDVPILGGVHGTLEGARPPAVVAVLSRNDACPTENYSVLRERPAMRPDWLMVDDSYRVFLASVEGDARPVHCLARATIRIRPSRALWATGIDVFGFELGFAGDLRAVLFVSSPVAMGISLPIVYFRASIARFLALEAAGNLVFAGAFDPAGISRVGVSASVALEFGIPEIIPRLLSFGGMVHGGVQSPGVEQAWVSAFFALNVSSLIELSGGR